MKNLSKFLFNLRVIKKLVAFLLPVMCILFSTGAYTANVGLLVVATGKYIEFVTPLVESADKYFCKGHNVTYFIFTDREVASKENVISTYQARLGWPYDSMMRGHIYNQNRDIFKDQDYLFACDADMLFVGEVGSEILSDHVATQHPSYVGTRGTYETRTTSKACILPHEGTQYFCGGFYGGSRDRFLQIVKSISENIDDDLGRGIVALWHDESHWNRYCIDHAPTLILNPSYCYAEGSNLKYRKKLLALNKNHSEFRK